MSRAKAKPSHNRVQLEAGQRYNRLVAIEFAGIKKRRCYWKLLCDCGTEKIILAAHVQSGVTRSCGCLQKETFADITRKHGRRTDPIYRTWAGMIQRCENPHSNAYHRYGGAGVTVCDEWRKDFAKFHADMGPRPQGTSLDRIDGTKGYEPENCRWASVVEQARNRKNAIKVTYDGNEVYLVDICEKLGVAYGTAYHRLKKLGCTVEEALSTSRKPRPSLRRP